MAPAEQQSSSGHGLVTRDPIYRQDLTLPNGMRAIGLTATPASVVRVAMRMIMQPRPDLVVSGINRGYNLGYSGYMSGTLAAARDAAMFGVPAVAASMPEERDASRLHRRRRGGAGRGAARQAIRAGARDVPERQHSPGAGGRISRATASCRRR